MEGARLVAEVLTVGCCSFMRGDDFPICEILLPKAEPLPVAAEAPAPVPVPEPAAEPTEPVENLLYIVLFRQGRAEIDPSLDENAVTLEDMVRSLDDIDGGVNIVVAGYASPEGSFAVNDRLSRRRAEAVKRYLLLHTGLSADDITAYTGAENWDGLREQVEKSDMPCRDEVLRIIDTVPIWDSAARRGRESELMKLGAGVPYKYMYRHFFPLLRNAAYIKIYIDK
jgi:hypothetical protein